MQTKANAKRRIVSRLSLMLERTRSVRDSSEFYEAVDIVSSPRLTKVLFPKSPQSQLGLGSLSVDDDSSGFLSTDSSESESSRPSTFYEGVNEMYPSLTGKDEGRPSVPRSQVVVSSGSAIIEPSVELKVTGQKDKAFVPPVLEEMVELNSYEEENDQPRRKSKKILLHEPKASKSHLKQPLLNPVDVDDDDDISQPWLGHSNMDHSSGGSMMSMSIARIDDEYENKQGSIGHEDLQAMACPVWCCF